MSWLFEPGVWIALINLTLLEIVLGVDKVFIAILAGKLPANQQGKARIIGLGLAMITRIALLFFPKNFKYRFSEYIQLIDQ